MTFAMDCRNAIASIAFYFLEFLQKAVSGRFEKIDFGSGEQSRAWCHNARGTGAAWADRCHELF